MGYSEYCCICGQKTQSYHNPDPLREDTQDCCDACNRLVIAVRMKRGTMNETEDSAYILRLRGMKYRELSDELGREGL